MTRAPAWGGGRGELDLPPEFVGVTTLGPALHVYPPKEGALLGAIVVTLIGGAIGVVAVLVAIFGPPPAAIAPGFVGLLLLSLGVGNVLRLHGAARSIVTYSSGFAVLVGSKVSVWPWADVASIITDVRLVSGKRSVYHVRRYVVSNRNGDALALLGDRFDNVEAMSESFKKSVFPISLPPLQTAWDSGQTLKFGDVTVSRDFIDCRGHRLAWSAVRNVVVKEGRLIVTPKEGSPRKVRVSRIPNVEMLGSLIGVEPTGMQLTYY